jgi:hypothetical protein
MALEYTYPMSEVAIQEGTHQAAFWAMHLYDNDWTKALAMMEYYDMYFREAIIRLVETINWCYSITDDNREKVRQILSK